MLDASLFTKRETAMLSLLCADLAQLNALFISVLLKKVAATTFEEDAASKI